MNENEADNIFKNKMEDFVFLASDKSDSSMLYTQDFSDELRVLVDNSDSYEKSYKYKYYDSLYVDALIKKALDIPVDDSISEWRTINDAVLKEHDKRLEIKNFIIDTCKIARKYGEALLLPVLINKKNKLIETIPLNVPFEKVLTDYKNLEVLKLLIIEKFEHSDTIETNILKDNYGLAKHFIYDNGKRVVKIDPSRVIHIQNNKENKSFIDSILVYFYHYTSRNNEVTRAVNEANWIILKTNFKMIQQDISARLGLNHVTNNHSANREIVREKTEEGIKNRLINMRANAHSSSSYAIDKDMEDIQQIKKDNIDQMNQAAESSLQLIAGTADVPMSRFLGRKVSGMGGSADTPNYIQFLHGFRSKLIDKNIYKLDHFLKSIYKDIKSIDFTWNDTIIQKIEYSQDRTPLEKANNTGTLQTG